MYVCMYVCTKHLSIYLSIYLSLSLYIYIYIYIAGLASVTLRQRGDGARQIAAGPPGGLGRGPR